MRRTQEKFLEAMQERGCLINLHLEPEKAGNGLDQKLYEKMTASIRNVKTSYVTVEDYVEDQEIKLENKKNN